MMKIIHDYPPIWEEVNMAGMRPNPNNIAFTYCGAIYVPSGRQLDDHVVAHEEVHGKQQGEGEDGARAWWSRYIIDPYFRIEQEAEAYARQYDFICVKIKDRNQRHKVLTDLGRMLAGPTYGSVVNQSDACAMIKNKAKTKK